MNHKIDCRIIQDLLPSYVDGLTSEYTSEVIAKHLAQCESCQQIFQRMQEHESHIDIVETEIKYMKKIQKRMSGLMTTAFVSVLLVLLGALAAIMIYNRVVPKNYQDVFETQEASWFVVTHLESGSTFTLQDSENSDFQGMLELSNYYYDGSESNIIEGDLFLISGGNSYGQLYDLKLTDQGKLYYNQKVYNLKDSGFLWAYLNEILHTDSVWLDYTKEKYHYLKGEYFMETDGPEDLAITFELNLETRLFSLLPSKYSSYWETGTFDIDGLTITLDVENAADYVFHITEEGILTYDAEMSAPLYSIGATVPIPDGTRFIKK